MSIQVVLPDILRRSFQQRKQYRAWKKAIVQRDKKCVLCGRKSYLVADYYPISFNDLVNKFNILTIESAIASKVLTDIHRGRTLCDSCNSRVNKEEKEC